MTIKIAALTLTTISLFAANVLFASEPAGATPEVHFNCEAQNPAEARSRADLLMQQVEYQRAGECYLAAGEYDLANRAFLRGTRPAAEATRQAIVEQREAPRALVHQLKTAFHGSH